MTEQDDLNKDELDKKYRAVSNEQPCEEADQFIIQAAADAVAQKLPMQSSRRWHMPVSIAAAAVITVSVVTSLKPWVVSVPTSSEPEVRVYEEADFNNSADQYEPIEALATSEKLTLRKKTEAKKQRQRVSVAESELSLKANASASLSTTASSPVTLAKELKQGQMQTEVDKFLTDIEQFIASDNYKAATIKLKSLLEVSSIESYSPEQQQRIQLIQQNLQSTGIHQ